jgi:serine/threonine protein kinase
VPQSYRVHAEPFRANDASSVADKATIPPQRVPWISRIREAGTAVDPKATISYVVARDALNGPTIVGAPDLSPGIRDEFASGTLLQDRYRLIKELGRGGMGVVYLGRDQRLDRSIAVKVILAHDGGSTASATMDSRLQSSFADEARLGASLTHPAIATVFDYGFQHDKPFTVFEYIEGETLRELIERRGRLPLDEVRLIIGPLAQALDFAHERRIVHRDLKPENIRATEQRQFKILDLGLAREFSRQEDWRFAGTPAYAAPEQAAEQPSDGRTDQYALAVIVFELLTGRRPFVSDSWLDLLEMHYSTPPPKPRSIDPEIPETVEQALLRSLEKDPNGRYSTCTELAVALGCQFLTGPAPLPRILLETEINKMGGRWKTVVYPFTFFKRPKTYLALAPDALWAIHRTELMRWPLSALCELRWRGRRGLSFRIRGVVGKDLQWFRFNRSAECTRWREMLVAAGVAEQSAQSPDQDTAAEVEATPEPSVEPVVLLKGRPGTRFQLLGAVEAKAPNRTRAESASAIRGAMMGADAVVDLNSERLPGFVRTEHRISGTAVRAVDEEGRLELKSRWFAAQLARVRFPMLLMAVLFGGAVDYLRVSAAGSAQPAARGVDTVTVGPQFDTTLAFAFWLVIVSLTVTTFVSRWPQLVRPTAICFLAKAVQNGLAVLGSAAALPFLTLALLRENAGSVENQIVNPTVISTVMVSSRVIGGIWALSFLFFYLYLGRRAWRIDQEFRTMAAGSLRSATVPRTRDWFGRLAWCLAVGISLCLIGAQTAKFAQIVVDGVSRAKRGVPSDDEIDALARTMNDGAWNTVTDPSPESRGAPMAASAVMQAEQAVSRRPDNAVYVRTLGAARYRAGDYTAAIRELEGSIKLGGFDARAGFFLAAARAHNRELEKATTRYDESEEWMRKNEPDNYELKGLRDEAAAALYQATRSASQRKSNQRDSATSPLDAKRVEPARNPG